MREKNNLEFDNLESLNNNLMIEIFGFLNLKELAIMMLVNKKCNKVISESDKIWNNIAQKERYPKSDSKELHSGKDFYKKQRTKDITLFAKSVIGSYTVPTIINQSATVASLIKILKRSGRFSYYRKDTIKLLFPYFLRLDENKTLHSANVRDGDSVYVIGS